MKIKEKQSPDGDYDGSIKSNQPIFLTFDDLVQLAGVENVGAIPYPAAYIESKTSR